MCRGVSRSAAPRAANPAPPTPPSHEPLPGSPPTHNTSQSDGIAAFQ